MDAEEGAGLNQGFKRWIREPGLWEDEDGNPHWSLPNLLDEYGLEQTDENLEKMRQIVEEMVAESGAKKIVVNRECPFCAAGIRERHKPGCPQELK